VLDFKIRRKIKNWKDRAENRADWRSSINKVKVRVGLLCHLGRRRRRRRKRRRKRKSRGRKMSK
jgi:hypothetical protein